METTCVPFWDDKKNFYVLSQDGKKFTVKKNGDCFFCGCLLKLTKIEEYPVRPLIIGSKIIFFNYSKGIEIHNFKDGTKKYIDVRAVWRATSSGNRLFLQKRTDLVMIDIETEEIIEKTYVSESFDIIGLKGYLLFYKFKRNKTYLYEIATEKHLELPSFNTKFEIITQIIKKDNELIVFYAAAKALKKPIGVYIYNIEQGIGYFSYELSEFSANGHKYLDLIEFSFNNLDDEKIMTNYEENYTGYLQFLLRKFGFFAFLYYIDNKKLSKINDSYKLGEIEKVINYFVEKLSNYPTSNAELMLLLNDMNMAENRLNNVFTT